MERSEQLRVVEALVLASPEPLSAARVAEIAPECTPALVKELIAELNEHYLKTERAFEIWEIAGGYQVRTRAEFSGYLQKLQKQRPLRLSNAALETLSIVAYKQPATRAEIEYVRGVDVGAVLRSLLERGLVKIAGHKEVPGRPLLYATTRRFLEVFGLESLKNLPALRELEDLAREHGLENPETVETAETAELNEGGDGSVEIGDAPSFGDEESEPELGEESDDVDGSDEIEIVVAGKVSVASDLEGDLEPSDEVDVEDPLEDFVAEEADDSEDSAPKTPTSD